MFFSNLIETNLESNLIASYRIGAEQFEVCLNQIPAFANCLICHVTESGSILNASFFLPAGCVFDPTFIAECFSTEGYLELYFFNAFLENVPVFCTTLPLAFQIDSLAQLWLLINLLKFEDQNNLMFKQYVLGSTISKMVIYLLREMMVNKDDVYLQIKNHFKNERYFKILTFIHQNINADIDFDDIASQIFLSTDYVSQFFKKNIGVSMKNYLIDQKVKQGLYQLVDSTNPIAIIAAKSGFTDQAYFNRRFKQVYALNPMEVRKRYRELSFINKSYSNRSSLKSIVSVG